MTNRSGCWRAASMASSFAFGSHGVCGVSTAPSTPPASISLSASALVYAGIWRCQGVVGLPAFQRWIWASTISMGSDHLSLAKASDILRGVADLLQHLVGVLAQFRGNANLRRRLGKMPWRAVHLEGLAVLRIFHLGHVAVGQDVRIVRCLQERVDRRR